MKKYLLLTAIVILLGQMVAPTTAPKVDASAEEYAVYSAAIANWLGDQQDPAKGPFVIPSVTATDAMTSDKVNQDNRYFVALFPTLKEEVAEDYRTRNKEPLHLKAVLQLKQKYLLVDSNEIKKIFKRGGWGEFYKRYPDSGGFISVSRPGFNKEMNQALIFIEHGCGDLCGTGHYVLLEKSGDTWKVIQQNLVWIS